MEDAEYAMVMIGSAAGTAKDAVDELRAKGEKVGLIKIRLFRPFPAAELAHALSRVKAVAIMDRSESFSANGGPIASELTAALFQNRVNPLTVNYMYGLGGRDLRVCHVVDVFREIMELFKSGDMMAGNGYRYVGLRDENDPENNSISYLCKADN